MSFCGRLFLIHVCQNYENRLSCVKLMSEDVIVLLCTLAVVQGGPKSGILLVSEYLIFSHALYLQFVFTNHSHEENDTRVNENCKNFIKRRRSSSADANTFCQCAN